MWTAITLAMACPELTYHPRFYGRICKVKSRRTDMIRSQLLCGCSSTFIILIFICFNYPSIGFTCIPICQSRTRRRVDGNLLKSTIQSSYAQKSLRLSNSFQDDGSEASDAKFMKDLSSRAEEIQVDLTRDRLEQANTIDFLKRRPRKLYILTLWIRWR